MSRNSWGPSAGLDPSGTEPETRPAEGGRALVVGGTEGGLGEEHPCRVRDMPGGGHDEMMLLEARIGQARSVNSWSNPPQMFVLTSTLNRSRLRSSARYSRRATPWPFGSPYTPLSLDPCVCPKLLSREIGAINHVRRAVVHGPKEPAPPILLRAEPRGVRAPQLVGPLGHDGPAMAPVPARVALTGWGQQPMLSHDPKHSGLAHPYPLGLSRVRTFR